MGKNALERSELQRLLKPYGFDVVLNDVRKANQEVRLWSVITMNGMKIFS